MNNNKLLSLILVFFLLCPFFMLTSNSDSDFRTRNAIILYIGSPESYVNNEQTLIDSKNASIKPIIDNNRTLVPLRFIAESLGAEVSWIQATSSIKITLDTKVIELQINSLKMKCNGKDIKLDVAPKAINDRTFVPVRAITEAFGKKVFFNNNLIIISDIDNIYDLKSEKQLIDALIARFTGEEIAKTNLILPIDTIEKSVVMVEIFNDKGVYTSQGSGFCIREGLFLTNYHVVKNSAKIKIVSSEDISYEAEGIVKFDPVLDLAIIKTKQIPDIKPLSIGSNKNLKRGDSVLAIGSPLSLQNTVSDGIISGFRSPDGVKTIQITAPITSGSSGGPLFDKDAEVIGICTSTYKEGNLNFAVSIDYIDEWLTDLSSISFENIKVLSGEGLKFLDPSVSDKEILDVITQYYDAFNEGDADKIFGLYQLGDATVDDESYTLAVGLIKGLFESYDFECEILNCEIIQKTTVRSIVRVEASITARTDVGEACEISTLDYTLVYVDNKWFVEDSESVSSNLLLTTTDVYVDEDYITETSVDIEITTSLDATTEIMYWKKGQKAGARKIAVSEEPDTYHYITLSELEPATEYEYQVKSVDEDKNVNLSQIYVFKTTDRLPLKISWYKPGYTGYPADEMIEEEANKYLLKKKNLQIDLNYISNYDYRNTLNILLAAGEKVDLCATSGSYNVLDYYSNAKQERFTNLDPLLDTYAPQTKKMLGESFLKGARINGNLYGIPANYINASQFGLYLRKDLVEKYNFDLSKINSLEDFEPIFDKIKQKEPSIYPIGINKISTIQELLNHNFIGSKKTPGVLSTSDSNYIVNELQLPETKKLMNTMHSYYDKGYSYVTDTDMYSKISNGQIFSIIDEIDPSRQYNIDNKLWIGVPLTPIKYTNQKSKLFMQAIPKSSKIAEPTMSFVELLYTDKYLINLFDYGVEGTHYQKKSDNTISFLPNKDNIFQHDYYKVGNALNLYAQYQTTDYTSTIASFNQKAITPKSLGFEFDDFSVLNQVADCSNVWDKYLFYMYSGKYDAEEYTNIVNDEFLKAGLDIVLKEKQKQFNAFLKAN